LLRNFVSNDRFYTFDRAQGDLRHALAGAKTARARPVLLRQRHGEMERHFKSSRKPLFMFIQTMSAHWPYDFKYQPDVEVPGGGPVPIRDGRVSAPLSMAKIDFDFLNG